MRLIDADMLIEEIEKIALEVEQQTQGRRNGKTLAQGILFGFGAMRITVLEQPFAYEPENIVKELEKLADKANDKILEDVALSLYYDGYEDAMRTAVEIVKGGGVDG